MTAVTPISRLRRERLGLTMIAASLLGIAVISFIILDYQNSRRLADIRAEGVSLIRVLGRIAYDDLVAPQGSANILEALVYASGNDSDGLLYAAVSDTRGRIFQEASQSGVFAPPFNDSGQGGSIGGEVRIHLPSINQDALEFFGPLLKDGEPAGYVRVGYEIPRGMSLAQLPFFGTLALIVFLLTSLIYLLVRREIRPIRQLQSEISAVVDSGNLQTVSVAASGELAEFMQRFNAFVGMAQQRISFLEEQESKLVSAKKLISYRRSRVERVLETLPYGILVMDETGGITFVNATTAHLLGVDIDDIRNADNFSWSQDAGLIALLNSVKQRCRNNFVMDPIEIPAPNSTDRTLEVAASQLRDGSGALIVFRDATQEVMARKSRDEFVAHVAHELKTPLNTLSLYSEALQGEEGADAEFRVEAANVIADEVERLASLVSNLLSITKIESGNLSLSKTLVKPRDLLVDIFEGAKRGCRKPDVKFELLLPAEMTPILADKELLRVAINNLLTNAIKYNRPDGTVTLSAEEENDSLVIDVKDTGIGINTADQARVFSKFFRSEDDEVRARPGHGLGLSLTRDIVQIHNGALNLSSAPGQGSQFRLVLWKDVDAVRKAM